MPTYLSCPGCKTWLSVPDGTAAGKCPKCGGVARIGHASANSVANNGSLRSGWLRAWPHWQAALLSLASCLRPTRGWLAIFPIVIIVALAYKTIGTFWPSRSSHQIHIDELLRNSEFESDSSPLLRSAVAVPNERLRADPEVIHLSRPLTLPSPDELTVDSVLEYVAAATEQARTLGVAIDTHKDSNHFAYSEATKQAEAKFAKLYGRRIAFACTIALVYPNGVIAMESRIPGEMEYFESRSKGLQHHLTFRRLYRDVRDGSIKMDNSMLLDKPRNAEWLQSVSTKSKVQCRGYIQKLTMGSRSKDSDSGKWSFDYGILIDPCEIIH